MVLAFFHPWAAFLMWVKKKNLVQIIKLQLFFLYHSPTSSFSKIQKTLQLKGASKNTLGSTSTFLCVYRLYKQMVCIQRSYHVA